MLDEACAAAMVACFNTNPPQVRGRTVYVQFSNHRELKIDQSHSVIVSKNHFSTRYQFVGFFSFFYFGRTNIFTAQHNLSNESVTNTYIHTQIDRWRNKYKQIHTHINAYKAPNERTMSKSFSLSKPVLFFRCHYNSSWVFHFLLYVSLSLLISFIFSILLCFGVVKRGPYHHLFCVIRSVIVLFRFAVRFCRFHIHSVRVDSVRSGVARATIQSYRLTFPPLFMASMPRFRQKSKHKNDRETRIGSHTHTHTHRMRERSVFFARQSLLFPPLIFMWLVHF